MLPFLVPVIFAVEIQGVLKLKKVCDKGLNAQLIPICHLLALAGAHYFVDISRIRV
jgi:hypothetical protein